MPRLSKLFSRSKPAQSRIDLIHANENLKYFIAELSHEINHRIAHISGFLQVAALAIEKGKPIEHIKADIEIAKQETQFLVAILDNVLELSQIEAGVVRPIQDDIVYLRPFFQLFVNSYMKAFPNDSVNFALSFGADSPDMTICDTMYLGQILFNLVGNALKFNTSALPVAIEVRGHATGFWSFSVKNEGDGIPTDKITRIFEPYFTLKSKAMKGAGLGLSIVKKKVELLRGKVQVDSQPGGFTTFTVFLPIKTAAS